MNRDRQEERCEMNKEKKEGRKGERCTEGGGEKEG